MSVRTTKPCVAVHHSNQINRGRSGISNSLTSSRSHLHNASRVMSSLSRVVMRIRSILVATEKNMGRQRGAVEQQRSDGGQRGAEEGEKLTAVPLGDIVIEHDERCCEVD